MHYLVLYISVTCQEQSVCSYDHVKAGESKRRGLLNCVHFRHVTGIMSSPFLESCEMHDSSSVYSTALF